jgi:DNA-directed RNA polymerase subunit M/transcription elongation factor TFIIS
MDLHDRITVHQLRIAEKVFLENREAQKSSDPDYIWNLIQYFERGERYLSKSSDIEKWMERDRTRDGKIESAKPPEGIYCLNCNHKMECEYIDLQTHLKDEPLLFIYRCSHCSRGRAFYDNGEEYRTKPELCPKCNKEMKQSSKKEKGALVIISICPNCQHKETHNLGLSIKEEIDYNFEADRDRFCLTEKEGARYLFEKESIAQLTRMMQEDKKNKEIKKKLAKIKYFPIGEIKKLMTEALEKESYADLKFENPEIDKFISIAFTAQDNMTGREEYMSRMHLKKIIDKNFSDTNWRLMSDGIHYRLGFVSGRIRGYEGEEQLIKLIK